MNRSDFLRSLRLPVVAAPMFLVSGPELLVASCRAGIAGSMPALNARTPDLFAQALTGIAAALADHRASGGTPAPYGINIVLADQAEDRTRPYLDLCAEQRVPLVITSVGNPARVVPRVHEWGGLVFHDVTTLRHARKAADAGVDGLILVAAGAGGHAGSLSPFALLPQVRRVFDGIIVLAGGIADGAGILAARALGADLVYMGTRLIAAEESLADPAYKAMLVAADSSDVVLTDAISGLPANFLRQSIVGRGLDPDALPPRKGPFRPDLPDGIKAWRDVWSAGHGVGLIDRVEPVAAIVDRLAAEYRDAQAALAGRP